MTLISREEAKARLVVQCSIKVHVISSKEWVIRLWQGSNHGPSVITSRTS
jgi:hypothetical protein